MNLLHRISYGMIVFTIIALVSGPGFAATVYFGNIGDQPQSFAASGYPTGSFKNEGPCKDIPNDATKGYIRDYIVQAATFFKLSPAFIAAVMKQESAFNPNASSSAGARGLMQLMPDTYQELNDKTIKKLSRDLAKARGYSKADASLRQIYTKQIESQGSPSVLDGKTIKLGVPTVDDKINPKYNTFLGVAYYRQHYDDYSHAIKEHKAYSGDQLLRVMLVAYNAGPGVADKFADNPPYEEPVKYVKNIMKYYPEYQACSLTAKPGTVSLAVPNYAQAAGTPNCAYTSVNIVASYLQQQHGRQAVGNPQPENLRTTSCGLEPLKRLNDQVSGITTYADSGTGLDQQTYFQKIQTSLDKGFPVIQGVDVFHSSGGLTASNRGHFWVISGYDTTSGTPSYTVVDPASGQTHTESQATLWQHGQHTTQGQVLFYVP